jgi:hypothetical protein
VLGGFFFIEKKKKKKEEKEDIMDVFKEFRSRWKFEKSINATFVFLIPKKADVVDIKDFCPISWIVNFNRGNMGYCPSWI